MNQDLYGVDRLLTILAPRIDADGYAGNMQDAEVCRVRWDGRRFWRNYHPDAPSGISCCYACRRIVLRGMGRWWER